GPCCGIHSSRTLVVPCNKIMVMALCPFRLMSVRSVQERVLAGDPPAARPYLRWTRDLDVGQRPFFHETHAHRSNSVDDQLGVVDRAEVLAEQGAASPDLLDERTIGDHLGNARDPHLVVVVVEVAE